MTFISRYVRVAGRRLHVRSRALPGTPWVLLHGLAVSHRYLMPTATALPGPVYAPDLPGFGRSGAPRRALDPREHAAVIAAWMDADGLRGARVLGGSYGCQVAVELAISRPDLAGLLVLAGPTADPAAGMVAHALRLARDLPREDLRHMPAVVAGTLAAGPRRIVATLRTAVRHRIERRLPLVTAPVLVLRGEHDPIAPDAWTSFLAGVASCRTLTVPGAGHNVVTTAGPRVAAAATAFAYDMEARPVSEAPCRAPAPAPTSSATETFSSPRPPASSTATAPEPRSRRSPARPE
ncbi:alpha/beta fold hydrolase [Catenuloplanes atrovinosus]|uniref:Pimeloyl-ACP methyl ester carboxylesterase n=1 Tax=Catenuloplanes atrovinosus TaxID=137266 RepID=A0AAE4CAS6_9ACTN|nr:alpha/beta hydrolase [Catenuloplanes atrovinosus]MDR7274890.1 pimeloyl-ACP methyl ester carboxylesterase [Catenuloplanes atrovinosus]